MAEVSEPSLLLTLRWREMDSNFQYASIVRWHQATDLPLPPFVEEERSESGRADYRAMSRDTVSVHRYRPI
jgi:hypothetical protein